MNEKELTNKLRVAYQTLEIYNLYQEEFFEKYGITEGRTMIDKKLDEINDLRKQLQIIRDKNNSNEK